MGRTELNMLRPIQMFLAAALLTAVAACSTSPTVEDYAARAQMPTRPTITAPAQTQPAQPQPVQTQRVQPRPDQAAQSQPQPTQSQPVAQNTPPASQPSYSPSVASNQYILGNGDRLRITVFGEPELSGEFVVDGAGQISMPLIGEITAAGQSIRDLQRLLETQYREGYLNNPQISAEILNYRPYYILGEVNRPGEYPYMSGLTVLNAVATAQGFTYRANKGSVFIRGANDRDERKVKLTSSLSVRPGDTIRIGERLF